MKKVRHANEITEYDLENFPLYLQLHDMKKAGRSWKDIASTFWGKHAPEDYKKILKENYKRSQWMIETGYKLMMRDNPMSRDASFDALVKSGQMSADERAFLESDEGSQFWPKRTKH